MHYVYVIRNELSKIYIGRTSDLKKRIIAHNQGQNISTRGHQWELVYYEAYKSIEDAIARENQLKKHGQAKRWLKHRIAKSLQVDI
jgi:putative endonuclease